MAGAVSGLITFGTQNGPIATGNLDTNFSAVQTAVNSANSYSNYLVDTGSANTIAVTVASPASATLTAGLTLTVKVAQTNTGPTTLNLNAGGAVSVIDSFGNTLSSNTLVAGSIYNFVYNGSKWQLAGGSGSGGSLSTTYADTFTCTAGQTAFTLSANPNSINNLTVSLDGAVLVANIDYTWTGGTTLTLTTGAKVNQTLFVRYLEGFVVANVAATTVQYTQGGTGSVTRTVTSKLQESVSVKDFGAVGDGSTDDTTAVSNAFAAASAGATLLFPAGTYKIGSVNFTGKAINLSGYGATITCTSATGAVYKTDHGNKLQVRGISFTGTSTFRAINHQTTQSGTVYDELEIVDCTFDMATGIYGIYSVGSREVRILNCTFLNSSDGYGIYFKDSVSPFVDKCIFKGSGYTARAIYYPGTGTAYDAGLVLRDSEIMGYDKGLEVVGCDWLVIEGCTIDYCNYSIKLAAQDGAQISNNYIGSVGANPALWITYDASAASPTYCDKIVVVNNAFTGHYTGGNTYDCILIDGTVSSDNIQICHNSIAFFTRYGIQFNMTNTRMCVHNNSFNQRATFGVFPIYCALGTSDSGISIKHNFFNNTATITGMNVSFAQVNENFGCVTEGRGQVIAGSGVSTFNIAHGMSYTPATSDCQVVASNAEAANKNVYVSSVDATNLVAGFTSATAANAGVNWRIRRGV